MSDQEPDLFPAELRAEGYQVLDFQPIRNGRVYRVQSPDGSIRAVRVNVAQLDPAGLDRFEREALAGQRLRGEHVAHVFGHHVAWDGHQTIVTEHVEGRSLDELLAQRRDGAGRKTGLSAQVCVEYVLQACYGLAELHALGVCHRDVKPTNLVLTDSQVLKVVGWGAIPAERVLDAEAYEQLMQSGVVAPLKLAYGAPEQFHPEGRVGPAADVWALGVILHELLSGDFPRWDPFHDPAPPVLAGRVPEMPPELDSILQECLRPRASERLPNASYLGFRLSAIQRQFLRGSATHCAEPVQETQDIRSRRTGPGQELKDNGFCPAGPGHKTEETGTPSEQWVEELERVRVQLAEALVAKEEAEAERDETRRAAKQLRTKLDRVQQELEQVRASLEASLEQHQECRAREQELYRVALGLSDRVWQLAEDCAYGFQQALAPLRPEGFRRSGGKAGALEVSLGSAAHPVAGDRSASVGPWVPQKHGGAPSAPSAPAAAAPWRGLLRPGDPRRAVLAMGSAVALAGVLLGALVSWVAAPVSALELDSSSTAAGRPTQASVVASLASVFGGRKTVTVPGGAFRMGSVDGDKDEQPMRPFKLRTFQLDETEVTVADWEACVQAGTCQPPNGESPACNYGKPRRAQHPVNCVSWHQAEAYCRWAGKRLPSEAEWEFAARGSASRQYPWGLEAPNTERVCVGGNGTCLVYGHPKGATPQGLAGMAGNVWEWTDSPYCPSLERHCRSRQRAYRGGGWREGNPAFALRTASRAGADPNTARDDVGLRCAR
ncbi:SUMF1/EgtB/PvdO family nonheme iron enzyme [Myxococcota bacterium]